MVKEYFIQILKDYISENTSQIGENIDWEDVLELSQSHQVTGIVYAKCKDAIPESFLPKFLHAYDTAFYYYMCRSNLTDRLFAELQGITAFSVKGLEVAKYYPIPALRTMGDCDIIVLPSEMEKAVEIMRRIGFAGLRETERDYEWHCEKDGIDFEVHGFLAREDELDSEDDISFFNGYAEYVSDHQLDCSFHFLFLLNHLRRHIRKEGVGIRQFVDVAVMIQKELDLKWDWIVEKLQELNMMQFASCCFSLIESWFEISAPVEFERMDKVSMKQITEWILNNGVFGHDDKNFGVNQKNNAYQELKSGKGPLWIKRIIVIWKRLFPPYQIMVRNSCYSFIKGKSYLVPAAWMKRIGLVITGKRKNEFKKTMDDVMMPVVEIEKKKNIYEKLGL